VVYADPELCVPSLVSENLNPCVERVESDKSKRYTDPSVNAKGI